MVKIGIMADPEVGAIGVVWVGTTGAMAQAITACGVAVVVGVEATICITGTMAMILVRRIMTVGNLTHFIVTSSIYN
jgi:hypothetical protein